MRAAFLLTENPLNPPPWSPLCVYALYVLRAPHTRVRTRRTALAGMPGERVCISMRTCVCMYVSTSILVRVRIPILTVACKSPPLLLSCCVASECIETTNAWVWAHLRYATSLQFEMYEYVIGPESPLQSYRMAHDRISYHTIKSPCPNRPTQRGRRKEIISYGMEDERMSGVTRMSWFVRPFVVHRR